MKHLAITLTLQIAALTSMVHATTWTSPDGKVSFDLPGDGSLVEVKNPPAPATAMWNAADNTARVVFATQPHSQDTHWSAGGLRRER